MLNVRHLLLMLLVVLELLQIMQRLLPLLEIVLIGDDRFNQYMEHLCS